MAMRSSKQTAAASTKTASQGLRGTAVLALWGNADPEMEDGFNDWYTHEHLPERINIPGFLRARRWVSCLEDERTAHWKYFTLYEVDSAEVLASDAYLAMLNNPTPGTRRFLPGFTKMSRTVCHVSHSVARGTGGNAVFVEFGPKPGAERRLRDWVVNSLSRENMKRTGCLAVHLCEVDDVATRVGGTAEAYKSLPTTGGRWLLVIEGAWPNPALKLEEHLRDLEGLEKHGALPDYSYEMYRLLAALELRDFGISRPIR
jgi:hypothetical protein